MIPKIGEWIRKKRVWIPLSIFVLYHLLFNSITGQILLDHSFESFSETGRLRSDVSRFSLFYGIEIRGVVLESGENFDSLPILEAERISLLYSLPSLFLGRVSLGNIGLENARIHLVEKDGVLNLGEVFPPGEKEDEEVKEEDEEDSPPQDSISLPIPISLSTRLEVLNLDFRYENRSEGIDLGWEDLTLRFLLDTKRTSEIPLDMGALDSIDSIRLDINPDSPIRIFFQNKDMKLDSPWNFSLSFHKSGEGEEFSMDSRSKIGGDQLFFRKPSSPPIAVDFWLEHDLHYFPGEEMVKLDHLILSFQNDIWLNLKGIVNRPFSEDREMELYLSESRIRLKPLSDFLRELPIPPMILGGVLQLNPLKVEGKTRDLNLDWQISARNLLFQKGKQKHFSRLLDVDLSANLDLDTEKKPTKEDPVPILRKLNIRKFRAEYNGLVANLNGNLNPTEDINLNLTLDRLNVGDFVRGLYGILDSRLQVTGKNMASLKANLGLQLRSFRFFMDRSRSGFSHNTGRADMRLDFDRPFGLASVAVNNFDLRSKNTKGGNALALRLQSLIGLGGGVRIRIGSSQLDANLTQLMPILPLSLKEKIQPIEKNISSILKMGVRGLFDLKSQNFIFDFTGSLPGLELKDLKGSASLGLSGDKAKTIDIRKLRLSGYSGILKMDLNGKLYEKPGAPNPPLGGFFGNLDLNLAFSSFEEKPFLEGISYRGNSFLRAKVRDNHVSGEVVSENSRFLIQKGKCPGEACRRYLVENLNLDLPVEHDLLKSKSTSLIEGDKSRFIKTYGRIPKDNFTIYQVIGTHPNIPGAPFAYIKGKGTYPGLSGKIAYKDNFLYLDGLKLSLLDGMVYGKDILLNVGSGDPNIMEFMGVFQVRDIDLKQLLSRKAQKVIDDGKIKADLNLSGRNLRNPIPNLNLYFSIFQIGSDFGKSALNVISTKGALMNYITDSYAVDKVEIELSKGLVYADVLFKSSLLSYMVSLEDSKMSQQRMPLANFLERAESEIATYR